MKNWQDQVVKDKRRTRVKKMVRFGGARRIPENKCVKNKEDEAVATLSLSVQLSAVDVMTAEGE